MNRIDDSSRLPPSIPEPPKKKSQMAAAGRNLKIKALDVSDLSNKVSNLKGRLDKILFAVKDVFSAKWNNW